jgi:ethanolamine utilization protein EutA
MSSQDTPKPNIHSVQDHQYGQDYSHTHDGESDHDHDHDFAGDDPSQESLWRQDNVILHSVGIDVGSSGTQVVFSRIHLRRIAEDLSSRYTVLDLPVAHFFDALFKRHLDGRQSLGRHHRQGVPRVWFAPG